MKSVVIITVLAIALAVVIGISVCHIFPQPPQVDSWYQREIIGQGELIDVAINEDTILISLQVMTGPYDPGNPTYVTYAFCLNNKALLVQNTSPASDIFIEPDHLDVHRFEIGGWYVLFRKTAPLRYLLLGEPGPPPNYPVTAPIYEP